MEQILEKENVWLQFNRLPDGAKREVINFIAFLQIRYQEININKHHRKLKLSDEPFVGVWKDRTDIIESTSWIRDIRKREWGN